jgi:hypothetical protein
VSAAAGVYGALSRDGTGVGDDGGAEADARAALCGGAHCRVSAFGRSILIADRCLKDAGRACPGRGAGTSRRGGLSGAGGNARHDAGGARMRGARASHSTMLIGAPQCRQTNVGGGGADGGAPGLPCAVAGGGDGSPARTDRARRRAVQFLPVYFEWSKPLTSNSKTGAPS